LGALRQQTLSVNYWNLLVVDNRCIQPLAEIVDTSWHPAARIVREEELGLTRARIRGVGETNSEIIVFVDDDNVLAHDYLKNVSHIAETFPFIGAWSGNAQGEFENSPPEWTRKHWGSLAIRHVSCDVWSNLPRLAQTMPCGAGLCVRRAVAVRYVEKHYSGERKIYLDRVGTSLISGGDNDLAATSCELGFGVGLFKSLHLQHLIPPERLTLSYLSKLAEGIHYSSAILDYEYGLDTHTQTLLGRLRRFVDCVLSPGPDREIKFAALRGAKKARRYIGEKLIRREVVNKETEV
jgi:glycosyltransferase involved in cell wall biosynthesis